MTRATLLRLLAHPTALNGADVRALEELAEAFPYCQTAHLLLAKAAHDQGSMLAGQRLRRAATYAADRALLRQLVEAAPTEELVEALPATNTAPPEFIASQAITYAADELAPYSPPATTTAPAALLLEDKPAQEILPAPPLATSLAVNADLTATPTLADSSEAEPPAQSDAAILSPTSDPNEYSASVSSEPDTLAIESALATTPADAPAEPAPAEPELVAATAPIAAQEPEPTLATVTPTAADKPTIELLESATELTSVASEQLDNSAATDLVEATAITEAPSSEVASDTHTEVLGEPDAQAVLGEELPPQAPPIRPPAEAEAARQEFGLSPDEPAEITAYQLPELELAITVPLTSADATPRLPPFSGVADVTYAPSEGSRFGYCLIPAHEANTPLIPGAALPPAGEFFEPDALLLAHVAAQPALATSSTTDLINSFLLRTPSNARRRTPSITKASEQTDLSVRSTRAAPDLASESLARILAQQGKTEQAITIYERLMVKNPEKMAYFVAQIDLLRP